MKKYKNFLIGVLLSIIFSVVSIYYTNINELNIKISEYSFLSSSLYNNAIEDKINFETKINFKHDVTDNLKYYPNEIPILAYYSVSEEQNFNADWISIKKFEEEMEYLHKNGFKTLTYNQLQLYIENGYCDVKDPLVITFDNGYKDFYDVVFPILKKYGFKGILFQITSNVDELSNSLTSENLKEISAYGIDIGIRGNTNSTMSELELLKKDSVIKSGVDDLERFINKKPLSFSFPYGVYDEGCLDIFSKYEIKSSFVLKNENVKKGQSLYNIPRILIDESMSLSSFINIVKVN